MIGSIIAVAVIAVAIAAAAIVWRPAIAAIEPPAPQSFDSALVKRGRDLAAIGNCNDCHTVRGGQDFAGGLPVPTPFGTIYSSNITPDAETGIGRWSEAAFRRAMQSGVDRDGRHLYPTFPYDHFTHVSDEDDRALYAYLMTRPPVHAPARDNQLSFPFDQRAVVAGWKLLFPAPRHLSGPTSQSAEWNRGAYLVEGLAHCGACHTPRNALGAESAARRLPVATSTTGMPMRSTASRRAGAMGCGRAVHVSAPGLASRPRRCARPDGAGGRQSVCGARRAMSARSRPTWPMCSARRRRIASAAATICWRRPLARPAQACQANAAGACGLCRGLRDLPCERKAAALWRDRSRAQHGHHGPDARNAPTPCLRESVRGKASAARSCRALPTA